MCVVHTGTAEAASECGGTQTGKHGQTDQAAVQTGTSRSEGYTQQHSLLYIHISFFEVEILS